MPRHAREYNLRELFDDIFGYACTSSLPTQWMDDSDILQHIHDLADTEFYYSIDDQEALKVLVGYKEARRIWQEEAEFDIGIAYLRMWLLPSYELILGYSEGVENLDTDLRSRYAFYFSGI